MQWEGKINHEQFKEIQIKVAELLLESKDIKKIPDVLSEGE